MASWLLSESPDKLAAFGASAGSSMATQLGATSVGEMPGAATASLGSVGATSFTVNWSAATAPSAAPVQGYRVFRQAQAQTVVQTSFGACPGENQNVSDVLTKWGSSAGVRVFNPGEFGSAITRPSTAGRFHVSWKPGSTVSSASVLTAVANLQPGDMVEVWHELDVKYRNGSMTLAEVETRVAQKNTFYDIIKANRPDLVVATTYAAWIFDNNTLYEGSANPGQAQWLGARVKADVVGADFDGIANLTKYPDWPNAIGNILAYLARWGYKGWTVPEFVHPRLDGSNGETAIDPTGSVRASWAQSWADRFRTASPPARAAHLFDTNVNSINGQTSYPFAVNSPEYNLWRQYTTGAVAPPSSGAAPEPVLAATLGATARSYAHSGLSTGSTYQSWVVAYNANGPGPQSNTVTVTTTGAPPPSAPASLDYSGLTSTSVTLTWAAATAPTSDPVQGYRVYQGSSLVQTVGASVRSTTRAVTAGSSYTMSVRAFNTAGEGPPSPSVTFTAPTPDGGGGGGGGSDVIVYTAGDIAHASYLPDSKRTGDLIRSRADKTFVIATGDCAYSAGSITNYNTYYHPNWGSFRDITWPVPGNHEYKTVNAQGYRDYFGPRVSANGGKLYYARIVGSWLFLAMDSGDAQTGGAGSGIEEAQVTWAQQQITANRGKYTGIFAYWHHPRFSSGNDGNNLDTASMVNMLRANNADIVLTAHDHNYERFEKLNAAGTAVDPGGIRHFTCGTGGGSLRGATTRKFGSVKYWGSGGDWSKGRRQGVVKFTLRPTNYSWEWLDASSPPGPETDTGTTAVNPK